MFLNIFKKRYGYSFIFVLFLSVTIFGQGFGTGNNETCDANKVMLHRLAVLTYEIIEKHPEKGANMPLIVIASLGTGETLQRYNLQRLKEVRNYFRRSPLSDNLIITAQGEKVKGQGKVDFYLDGVLQYRILLKRNQYLNLVKGGHCDAG